MALIEKDGLWHELAAISPQQWRTRALMPQGYREAADLLTEIATSGRNNDMLVFPIIFLYRHAIELHLKAIIHNGQALYDEATGSRMPLERVHNLAGLWRNVRAMMVAIEPDCEENDLNLPKVEALILELHELDERGTAYRYPEGPKVAGQVNLANMAEMLSAALDYLDGIAGGLEAMTEMRGDLLETLGD